MKIKILIFFVLLFILSLFTFRKALLFHFWRDDWGLIWSVLSNHKELLVANWRLHPGTAVEELLLVPLLQTRVLYWQFLGIFLRAITAFTFSLAIYQLMASKRTAVIAGLFYSVTYAGLEAVTWRSAHIVLVIAILLNLGIYFWWHGRQHLKTRFLGFIFFSLAVLADPGRASPIILLIPVLDSFLLISNHNKRESIKIYIRRNVIFVFSLIVLLKLSSLGESNLVSMITRIFDNPPLLKKLFISIGNLFLGWFREVPEWGGLSNGIAQSAKFGFAILITSPFIFLLGILKKSKNLLLTSFFIVWVFAFYLPNWLFDRELSVAGTHRYLGVSSIGFVGIFALLVSSTKPKILTFFLTLLFIFANIITINRILVSEMSHRSKGLVDRFWDTIDKEIPSSVNKEYSIILVSGNGIRGSIFDWSYSVPFGLKRGISEPDNLPILTGDMNLALSLLCQGNTYRPTLGGWVHQKGTIPLSNVFAWEVKGDQLVSKTQEARGVLITSASEVDCYLTSHE